MKNCLILLFVLPFIFSCKSKKGLAQTDKTLSDTVYIENPETGEVLMTVTTKNKMPNGNWVLQTINGSSDEEVSRVTMNIRINLKGNRVSGNDGCNQYSGELTKVDEKNIAFGPMAATKRACMVPAKYANQFYNTLPKVKTYLNTDTHLILKNEKGDKVMQFVKKEEN